MPAAELAAVVEAIYAVYGVHVPAAAHRPAARRGGPLDRSPTVLCAATSHLVITAFHHPGYAAPIGDHVMPMRKFQLVADGLAGRPSVRVEPPDPIPLEALLRVHTRRVPRRGAHRRAARARRVAEVPVVAGALAVGAADERRRARGGGPRARRRPRGRARERLPSFARRPRRGLLHVQRPRRRRRGAARRGPREDGRRPRPRPALRQRHRVALRRRARGSSTARSTATTTGRTRRTATCRVVHHTDGPNHVSFALPNGSGRAAVLEAIERGTKAILAWGRPDLVLYQAGADPYREDPYSPLDLDQTISASATASSSRGRRKPACRSRGCSRAATPRTCRRWSASTSAPSTRRAAVHGWSGDEARQPAPRRLDGSRLALLLPADRDPDRVLVQRVAAEHRLDRLHARLVRGALARLGARARAEEQPDRRDRDHVALGRPRHRRARGCSTATATAARACSRRSSSCR